MGEVSVSSCNARAPPPRAGSEAEKRHHHRILRVDSFHQRLPLRDIDTVIFDCDGVVWRGSRIMPGAIEAIRRLLTAGKRVLFITNDSSKTRQGLVDKLASLGVAGITIDNVLTSSFLAASWVAGQLGREPPGESVYVVGRTGIMEELASLGVHAFGGPADDCAVHAFGEPTSHPKGAPGSQGATRVGAVVVGFDPHFNYAKMAKAQAFLADPRCHFVAANRDATYVDAHRTLPGTGCIVAAIECACSRTPIVMGKPSAGVLDALKIIHPTLAPARTLMVGDRLDTDICFGRTTGMLTLLVESGVHCEADARATASDEMRPHFIAKSIAVFVE